MQIELIVVGKTDSKEVSSLVEMYAKRVNHYCRFSIMTLPDLRNTKNLSSNQQNQSEGERILAQLTESDYVVLLDEHGKEFRSVEFATWMERKLSATGKRLVFIIGGPYGFSPRIYQTAQEKISLSKMTFSHQMIRMIFVEQVYRAMTILRGEPYHHE